MNEKPDSKTSDAIRILLNRAVEAAAFAAVALIGQYQLLKDDMDKLKFAQAQCGAEIETVRKAVIDHVQKTEGEK